MKNIDNIKQLIDFIVAVIANIKLTKKPLLGIVLSLGKFHKFKIKNVKEEISDLSEEEKQEIKDYILEKGFSELVAGKFINNFESDKKTTIFNLVREFL